MEIQGNSVIDTVIEYASMKFGIELEGKAVSEQLRDLTFGKTMALIDAIKKEDDDVFSSLIDLSAVNESGGTISPTSAAQAPMSAIVSNDKVAQRRATIAAQDQARDASGVQRTVAGSNKAATGAPNRINTAPDPDDQQRAQNAQVATTAAQQAQANADEIARLKQLAMGQR